MKWSTANLKSPNYTENHEIYVGTHTGSFKKLNVGNKDKPHGQKNLCDLTQLDKESRITALAFGNEENSNIWLGRGSNVVQLHSLRSEQVERNVELQASNVVGLAQCGEHLFGGFSNGQIQKLNLENAEEKPLIISAGDEMSHLRQCATERHLIATGGKGRQNNLKIFDMNADGKQIFTSKNLPNDYLQLEVPVWDSDVGFISGLPHSLATCSRHGYVRVYDTRAQRRPVQCFATEDQMGFTCLTTHDNYIYAGTTMGALKAFDIRRMKTFVHTYKGFTGSLSDLYLDESGKYLASASLDRYVRVHHVDSCVMLYQCYVKSKATRLLIRTSMENPEAANIDKEEEDEGEENITRKKTTTSKKILPKDEEYDDLFENMQTVGDSDESEEDENNVDVAGDQPKNVKLNKATKRKNNAKETKTKKKRT